MYFYLAIFDQVDHILDTSSAHSDSYDQRQTDLNLFHRVQSIVNHYIRQKKNCNHDFTRTAM